MTNKTVVKYCKLIFEENKEWIFKEEPKIIGEEAFEDNFSEYKKLKGKDDKETYRKNLAVFFKITFNSYVTGYSGKNGPEFESSESKEDENGYIIIDQTPKIKEDKYGYWKDRQECWNCWVGYLGNIIEAGKYFNSVDNIHSYT